MSNHNLRSTHRLDHLTLRDVLDGKPVIVEENQDVLSETGEAAQLSVPEISGESVNNTRSEVSDLSLRESEEAFLDPTGRSGQVPNEQSSAAFHRHIEGTVDRSSS